MKFRQVLFWDSDPEKLNIEKNAKYIIERIFDLGNDDEVRWLWRTYDKALMKNVVAQSRSLRPSTKSLWTLMLQNR